MADLELIPKRELDRVRAADLRADERLARPADLCRLNVLGEISVPSGPGWGAEVREEVLREHAWSAA